MCWNKFNAADDEEDIEVEHAGEAELNEIPTGNIRQIPFVSGNHGRRCGRGRHGRPWPCEWDVGREPDRDERSEPPAATPPPGELNRWGHVNPQLRRRLQKQFGTTPHLFP